MTVTDVTGVTEEVVEVEVEEDSTETADQKKARERDFSKFTDKHQELADYVNERSGLDPITPNQVKALLALKIDFADTPEQKAKREERKAEREAEAQKYAGLTQEEIKAEKAAARADAQAAKWQEKVQAALAKAQAIREGKDASGEDLAAAVEAQQNGAETEKKRRIGRNR